MTRIPIDHAAPIACTATRGDLDTRIGQLEHLRAHLRRLDRTDGGLQLRFVPDADLAAHLARFVADEKGCCQFWGLELTDTATELTLLWEGPASVQGVLDDLEHALRSDEPFDALAGLL